jgi:hypothetical protein
MLLSGVAPTAFHNVVVDDSAWILKEANPMFRARKFWEKL